MNTATTNPVSQKQPFETWALVELFGHQRIVGRVTDQALGGASFIRVDVPNPDGSTRFTRMYGASAIYSISPVEREVAITLAQACDAEPVKPYELPRSAPVPALPPGGAEDREYEDAWNDE